VKLRLLWYKRTTSGFVVCKSVVLEAGVVSTRADGYIVLLYNQFYWRFIDTPASCRICAQFGYLASMLNWLHLYVYDIVGEKRVILVLHKYVSLLHPFTL